MLVTTRDNNSGTRATRISYGARTNPWSPFETEKDFTCATSATRTSRSLRSISERTRTPRATTTSHRLVRILGNWYLFLMTSQKKLFSICPRAIASIILPMIDSRTYLTEDNQNIRHIPQVTGSKLARRTGMTGVSLNLIKEPGKG